MDNIMFFYNMLLVTENNIIKLDLDKECLTKLETKNYMINI